VVVLAALEPIVSLGAARLRDVAARLRGTGLDEAYVARALRGGERLDDALRAPMRKWNARQRREPAAYGLRLFVLGDAVTEEEARAALGGAIEDALVERTERGFVARLRLTLAGGMMFFGDARPDGRSLTVAARTQGDGGAILGPSANTLDLVRAARPAAAVPAILDVGAGCGAAALLLADRAERVVAVDVSARAVALTRVNAMLNGVANVQVREGDLFAPVRGERFDAIVSHPPFVAGDAEGATFTRGGARGDELALRLLAGIDAHLEPRAGAAATLVLDWPIVAGEAVSDRVRRALGDAALDALLLETPGKSLDEYCTFHAAAEHPTLGEAFEAAAIAQRERLARLAVTDLRTTLTVVAPAAGRRPYTDVVRVRHFADAPPSPSQVDRMLRARDLAARGDDALLDARLRVPPGTRFDEIRGADGACVARLPDDRLLPAPAVAASDLAAARALDGAPRALDAAVPAAVARRLLLAGLVEPTAR
jgi:methylase of polypeptide subunit release factors